MKKCIFLVFIVLLVFCFFYFSYSCLNYLTYLHYKRTTGTTYDVLLKEKDQTNVKQGIIPYYLLVEEEQLKNISFTVFSL